MATTSQEAPEPSHINKVKVTILASEWGSSKGELSTINRELAIQLAKCPKADITFFVPQCSEKEKQAALSHNIRILEATRLVGYDELEWLNFPPDHLHIDIIVGHGVKLGRQAQVIRERKKCLWVQVAHTDPEELGMFKNYVNPISEGEEKHDVEVELCGLANYVVGVGPKLSEAFRKYLRWCKKGQAVFDLTPGIFDEFVSIQQAPSESKHRSILVFGRGDAEDFELKGFDIAGKAVADLPDTHLLFVGVPDGKHKEIAERLTSCGVPTSRLRVRGFVQSREHLERLFCEVDLALMPSRAEGFGLTGLEALSAGLPLLVSKNSGFGEALSDVPFGSLFVVDSEHPEAWAAAIRRIWDKDRKTRLEEATALRDSYKKKYSWDKQINDLLDKMTNLKVLDTSSGQSSPLQNNGMIASTAQASEENEDVTEHHADASSGQSSPLENNGMFASAAQVSEGNEDVTEHHAAELRLLNTVDSILRGGIVVNIYNHPSGPQTVQTAGGSDGIVIVPVQQEQDQQDCPTELNIWDVILSFKEPLNLLFQYLKNNLNVVVRRYDRGSLSISVECSSLQTLARLWEDYTSRHLNKVVQETLVTAEVLEKLGLTGIKLKTFISEEEYEKGKQIFLQNLVLPEQSPVLDSKTDDARRSQVELQDTASGSIVEELATTTELKESCSDVKLPQREASEIAQSFKSSQLQGPYMMEYSQEQLNYFRLCNVAFNLVPVGLRHIFKSEWDFRYKTGRLGEWKDRAQNGLHFYNNESRRSHRRNARYLATVKIGNTAEWDCTCLFFAILYSDSIGTTLSPAVVKDVDDIRRLHNAIARISEAKLTDADLQTYVGQVINAFKSLGLPTNDIDDIKNQTSFPTEEVENLKKQVLDLQTELDRTEADLQSTEIDLVFKKEEKKTLTPETTFKQEPFCILTSEPPHEIIRRVNDMKRITDKMQELYIGANGAVSTTYLSGNPGCGKSQLARQIAHQFFSTPTDNNEDFIFVATLNAESIETLADSYLILGKHLGVTEYATTSLESSKSEKPRETIQQLQRLILPKVKKFSKWMIIVDNVIDLSLVRGFLPPTGSKEWGHGQVLITTQDSSTIPHNGPHTYHESLSKGMQHDEAVQLLETVSTISVQEQGENVARVLDYQPLALAAAAYYVQIVVKSGSPKYSWTKYLEILTETQRNATEDLLASKSSAYPQTTRTAFTMATQRAVKADQVLRHTLSFFAICANDVLPLEAVVMFVRAHIPDQPEELIKAKIARCSLIIVEAAEGVEQIYLRLHNILYTLVKEGIIFNLESRENDQNMAEALRIFTYLLEINDHNYPLLNKLKHHCKSLLEGMTSHFTSPEGIFVENLMPFIDLQHFIGWLGPLADVCCKLSDFCFAKYVVDLACSSLKNIHDTDPNAPVLNARILSISGSVYNSIGEYNQAKELHEKALAVRKKIFGEEHADVATTYGNLASVYQSIGEYNQAKQLYEKALAIRQNIFGEEHADVAETYGNLASVYERIGQYNQAKKLYKKALAITKKIFGEEHPDIATSFHNLASVYESIGEYNQAKELYEKALAITKKIFGEEHPDVATNFHNLASVYKSIGEYNQAKKLYEKALMIRREIFGEEHPDVATSFHNLASVYESIGEYNQAKNLYKKALMIRREIFGEGHPKVATSFHNLASVYEELGEYNHAKELHEKALAITKKIFGEEHPDVATSFHNLASLYKSIGQYGQAEKLYEKALMIRREIFGEEHPDVATSFHNLASVYKSIGEYNQAKELHEKALTIRREVFSEEHADVARSYNNLALVYESFGEYNQAKELHQEALVIRKKIFGKEHADVAQSYNNLASVYKNIGEYNQAEKLYEKALMIRREIFGEEHPDVATSFHNLASVYESIGKYNQAKNLYEKALMIRREIFGEEHPEVATIFHNLASVYKSIGEYNQAKELHEKALTIRREVFSEEHADVATSYNNLALVYESIGEYNQAKELHKKALAIRKKIFGEEHADVAQSYNNLASVYKSIGRYNQAEKLYKKALMIRREIFGQQHPEVATIFHNLASVYEEVGEYNRAKELYEKALMFRRKFFGEHHPDVATSFHNLASLYYSIGEYNQAKELYEEALMIRKKSFGEEHPDVVNSYNNLALVYETIGEYNRAKELHKKALAIRKKIFGEEHADVAQSYNNLASVYKSIGEYNQAEKLYEKALMIRREIFGEEHPEVATIFHNLASVYEELGEYNRAKELYEKALMIRRKFFGEHHPDVATSFHNLASLYYSIGEYNQAKELYEEALMIRKEIFGEEHPDVVKSYNNLALVYETIGEYNRAKELHEKALGISKMIFGEHHPDVATSYNNLASVHYSIGEYNQAKELHEKALTIRREVFSEEHADVATSYNNLALVYESIGEYNLAKELHKKALAIRKKIFGEEHADVAQSYNNLALVYESIGEYVQAKELHKKALAIRKKIFGEEHADVAQSYNNLALVYESIGECSQVKELHEKALAIRKKIFGETHTDVAQSYINLALLNERIGEYNQAKERFKKALVISKNVFGEEHADVATTYGYLASVYNSIGKYNQAIQLYEKAQVIRKKIFGEEHAHVMETYGNLASVYEHIGEYNKAKELHQKALVIRRKIFGEEHADVATSYSNLASGNESNGEPTIRPKKVKGKRKSHQVSGG